MILVFGGEDHSFDAKIGAWVMDRVGSSRILQPGMFYAIGVVCGEKIAAGVVYHGYEKIGSGALIECSFAADNPRWAHPSIIRALLHYPFVQLGCHVMLARVGRKNVRSRKLVQGLGFTERGSIPNWPEAEDTILYAMRREAASRWLDKPEFKKAA